MNWDRMFLDLASHVANWSKDPSTQVGAVIVDSRRRVLSLGFNGFPRGVNDSDNRYFDREVKYRFTVHAELNAILNTAFPGSLSGSALYVTPLLPCCDCAKAIIQAGIGRVVVPSECYSEGPQGRWGPSNAVACDLFYESGVILEFA